MSWLWTLWVASFTPLAHAADTPDPCGRFRSSVDPATGTVTRTARAPTWAVQQTGATTTFQVLLQRAGHHPEPLADGDTVCLHLANGEDVALPVTHSAAPVHTPTKYDGVTWWRAEVVVPAEVAARIARSELVDVDTANRARLAGRGAAQRRQIAAAFACVTEPTP